MSQIQSRQTDPERGDNIQAVTGDGHAPHDQPQSASNLPLPPQQGDSNFGDSSGPIFSMYSKLAKEGDDQLVDRWQKDADGILIFTGLFSAAVATLLALSVPDLRPNSQDTSAFYLANIYQILADPNTTITSITSPVAQPPPFSPPRYAIWVNSLWFMSLVIGLTCALMATSLQQWARRYARITQPPRCSPEKRARMRAFFSHGAINMNLPLVVEGLPALIHLAVFLFFAGLIIFVLNVNHSISIPVISWIGLFSMLYVVITFMPMFHPDSPYYTPLSAQFSRISGLLVWFILGITLLLYCLVVVPLVIYALLRSGFIRVWIAICSRTRPSEYQRLRDWYDSHDLCKWLDWAEHRLYALFSSIIDIVFRCEARTWNWGKAAEELTRNRSSEIDIGILDWTIGAVGEDDALVLERFFELIPGFFNSQMVNKIKRPLPDMFLSNFVDSWGGFMTRNLLSNSISEEIKIRRLVISMNAIKEICNYADMDRVFPRLSNLRFDQITPSIQAVEILTPWCTSLDTIMSGIARYTVAKMLPYIQERDDRWIASSHDIYGLPEHILRDYISRGDDSVLLAIFNHAARYIIRTELRKWEMLPSISKFDIRNTVPGLQNEFCILWNDMVREANATTPFLVKILHGIRHFYIALHQGTDAAPTAFDASTPSADYFLAHPRLYPSCNLAAHHPDPTAPPSTVLEEPHNSFPHQSRSESQLYADGSTAQQAAEVNVTLQLTSSTDQPPPPHPGEYLLPPLTTAPGLFAPQANVVTDPSIHEYTETIAHDINPLVSMVTHPSPQPPLSTTDVVHAEEDISPQIAVVVDANIAMSSGALSIRGNRHDMVHPVPMEVSRHENEPVPSNPDINEDAPAPGGHLDD